MQMNANKKNKIYIFLPNMDPNWKTQAYWKMRAHRSGLTLSVLAQNYNNLRMYKYEMQNSRP